MSTSLQPVHALVPGANLEAYVHAVNGIPLLTPEQERELAESLFYKQDLEAARQMVLGSPAFCCAYRPQLLRLWPGPG